MTTSRLTFRKQTLAEINALQAMSALSDSAVSRLADADDRSVARLRRGDSIGSDLLERLYAAAINERQARIAAANRAVEFDGSDHDPSVADSADTCTAEQSATIPVRTMPTCPGVTTAGGGIGL